MFLIKSLKIHSLFGIDWKISCFRNKLLLYRNLKTIHTHTQRKFSIQNFICGFYEFTKQKKKTKINYHLRFLTISIYLKNLIVCVPIIGPKVKVIRFCELLHSNEKNYINIHRCHQKNYNRFSISLNLKEKEKLF